MELHRIINLVAVIAVIADVLWFILRGKKNGFGNKDEWTRGFIVKIVCIYAASLVIIILDWFLIFGTLSDVILNGCAVLGIEIANEELLPKPIDKD